MHGVDCEGERAAVRLRVNECWKKERTKEEQNRRMTYSPDRRIRGKRGLSSEQKGKEKSLSISIDISSTTKKQKCGMILQADKLAFCESLFEHL